MAVVYRHILESTGEPFYVGIGKDEARAYSKAQRSKPWKDLVSKYRYKVEVLYRDLTWEEACEKEKELIQLYGKRMTRTGTLVNITDGGDGRLGAYPSKETRKKMSESRKGKNTWSKGRKHTEETKRKLREYYRIHGSPNKGKPKSEETRKKLSEANKGKAGTWVGKKHSRESIERMKQSHGKGVDNARYGTRCSEDTKEKMKLAAKNRDNSKYSRKKSSEEIEKLREVANSRPTVTCPHCKKEGSHNLMVRWHFDNCKLKYKL